MFSSIVAASHNDFYGTPDRACFFANAWGNEFNDIGDAQHINAAAGFGEWPQGLEFLKRLDKMK